jgi:hypothetical protein
MLFLWQNDGKEAISDEEVEVHRGADHLCPPAGRSANAPGGRISNYADTGGLGDFLGTTHLNLRPKISREIKKSIKISENIASREACNFACLQGKSFIFCAFASTVAVYTRVKSEVQILYRPLSRRNAWGRFVRPLNTTVTRLQLVKNISFCRSYPGHLRKAPRGDPSFSNWRYS